MVRGTVSLPHGIGKGGMRLSTLQFLTRRQGEAQEAGADCGRSR